MKKIILKDYKGTVLTKGDNIKCLENYCNNLTRNKIYKIKKILVDDYDESLVMITNDKYRHDCYRGNFFVKINNN